jgi:hypothetical protein
VVKGAQREVEKGLFFGNLTLVRHKDLSRCPPIGGLSILGDTDPFPK